MPMKMAVAPSDRRRSACRVQRSGIHALAGQEGGTSKHDAALVDDAECSLPGGGVEVLDVGNHESGIVSGLARWPGPTGVRTLSPRRKPSGGLHQLQIRPRERFG